MLGTMDDHGKVQTTAQWFAVQTLAKTCSAFAHTHEMWTKAPKSRIEFSGIELSYAIWAKMLQENLPTTAMPTKRIKWKWL